MNPITAGVAATQLANAADALNAAARSLRAIGWVNYAARVDADAETYRRLAGLVEREVIRSGLVTP